MAFTIQLLTHSVSVGQTSAATQRAPGATPTPSAPSTVPVTCVPWPMASQG
jgi:hypothetical protein